MAALLNSMPAPIHSAPEPSPAVAPRVTTLAAAGGPPAPPYLSRNGWVPRKPSDFCDGGAYPECHVAQYPLDCGRKAADGSAKAGIVAVTVAEDGSVDYDALVLCTLDKLQHIGAHTIEEITTVYGPLTRTLQEEIIRNNYSEYCHALAQVLHQGRSLNMVSTSGSWG